MEFRKIPKIVFIKKSFFGFICGYCILKSYLRSKIPLKRGCDGKKLKTAGCHSVKLIVLPTKSIKMSSIFKELISGIQDCFSYFKIDISIQIKLQKNLNKLQNAII